MREGRTSKAWFIACKKSRSDEKASFTMAAYLRRQSSTFCVHTTAFPAVSVSWINSCTKSVQLQGLLGFDSALFVVLYKRTIYA